VTEERAKRKLTAILSADAKDYSRLMGEDELATVETLKQYRQLMRELIEKYSGRVVDSPGDNVLAEFGSVVDALECAVTIQKDLREKNSQLPENRRMEFRIGVNLGDVIDDEGRIYGDGVNVTARVEGLAEAGGICVSGIAFDGAKNKLNLGYEYLGEHIVKNIAEPVRVYKVLSEPEAAGKVIGEERPIRRRWAAIAVALIVVLGALAVWNFYFRAPPVEVASIERMAFPLPDKPSIAVLPFVNMSEDPKQEYFSDGLTEEIISALSRVPKLFVIARNTTFTYKNKPVKVQQVSEELGVRYVLEGSVRKARDRVRVTAQLIDATTGHHLWSERYDRTMKDIFALQDEITKKIITAMQVKLTEGEIARVYAKGTENLDAYLKFLQGRKHFFRLNAEYFVLARRYFEEAIALDPEFASPYSFMGQLLLEESRRDLKSPQKSIGKAFKLAQKVLALDESLYTGHVLLGQIHVHKKEHEKAIASFERAVALAPNYFASLFWLGMALSFAGRPQEAIPHLERAIRLDPLDPSFGLFGLGDAYTQMERYEEAITVLKQALHYKPDYYSARLRLAICYATVGREEEANAEAAEVLRLNPNFSVRKFAERNPISDKAAKERYIEALRKAGLPETPPLPLPDKPSIAVLPFVNMSGDPEQEYFSDGMTEEIITALSKVPDLFVIARNSSFTYKGKSVRIPTVGRELGVRYVLEGSVRKAGEKVRVTAQLVEAKTGNHLWAERYDRDLKDIFALQDEITMKIITAMQVKLTEGEQARLSAKGTDNLEAYLKRLQAKEYAAQLNKEDNALARKLAEEAISLDPEFSQAYSALSAIHWMDIVLGSSKSPEESLKRSFELAKKALTLDDTNSAAHEHLSWLFLSIRQYDKAIAEAERAVALAPGSADAYFSVSRVLRYVGRAEEAITWNKKAIRLDPMPFGPYLMGLAHAYWMAGRYDEALPACKKALLRSPKNTFSHMVMVATFISLGREEEARAEAQEVMRIDPNFSLAHWGERLPFKNRTDGERFFAALRKAGLK
jgi:TolB-like protein/class 3 adenylate cyclase/Flp pilus assembly protein TadD